MTRQRKQYKETEAEMCRLGTEYKKDLPKSPFIKEFEYGNSNEGSWCYGFSAEYPGPFWLSPEEWEQKRHVVLRNGSKTKRLKKNVSSNGIVANGKAKD
jgi:hypothetical protein